MFKRLVVAVFVASLTLFGVAPAATAAPSADAAASSTQPTKHIKLQRAIDWD